MRHEICYESYLAKLSHSLDAARSLGGGKQAKKKNDGQVRTAWLELRPWHRRMADPSIGEK